MKKIIGFILIFVLMISNSMSAFANTNQVKKKLEAAYELTRDTIEDELTFDKEYFEEYEKNALNILENLADQSNMKLSYDIKFTDSYYDVDEEMKFYLEFNDDGNSLAINIRGTMYDDTYIGKIYIDNNLIIIDAADLGVPKMIYYFKDRPAGEIGDTLEAFKYSNIKSMVSFYNNFGNSEEVQNIFDEYYNNFVSYLLKGDMSFDNNVISLSIDGKLIESYLVQLANKINNDERIKSMISSDELAKAYLDQIFEEFSQEILYIADEIDPTIKFIYTGKLEDNLLKENNLTFNYDGIEYLTMDVKFDENNTGLLYSNVGMYLSIYDDYYEEYTNLAYKLNFDASEDVKNMNMTFELNGDVYMNYDIDFFVENNEMNIIGNMELFQEPYFYVTKKPVYNMLTNEEYFENYYEDLEYEVSYTKDEVKLYEENLASAKRVLEEVKNYDSEETLVVDFDASMLMDYVYFTFDKLIEQEFYNYSTGEVLDEETFVNVLESYISHVEKFIDLNNEYISKAEKELESKEVTEDMKQSFDDYTTMFEENYEEELKEYEDYLKYLETGELEKIGFMKFTVKEKVTPTEYLMTISEAVTTSVYEGEEFIIGCYFKVSTEADKNTYDIRNAVNLLDYLQ